MRGCDINGNRLFSSQPDDWASHTREAHDVLIPVLATVTSITMQSCVSDVDVD